MNKRAHQTHQVEIADVKLVYHTAGSVNKPTLLFLHAWGVRVGWLLPVISAFASDFYVIAPEHPGLLRSSPLTGNSFSAYANFYKTFLKHIGVTGPIIVVGSSFGGGIASLLAVEYPQLVYRLILVDSVLPEECGTTWCVRITHSINRWLLVNPLVTSITKKLVVWQALGVPWSLLSKDEIAKRVSLFTTPYPLGINYSLLTMPVTLIWGTYDRFVHPIEYARAITAKNQHISFYEYNGSVPTLYKKPERVVPLIVRVAKV